MRYAMQFVLLAPVLSRHLSVVNYCQRPMIMAVTGGNSELPCPCLEGMSCNPENQQCYFDLPMPGKDWTIGAQQQVSLETPNPPVRQLNGIVADWSGKLEFYANSSDGGPIASAFCNNKPHCPAYQGLNGVATAVEFTLVPGGKDFYDVSVINGYNVPIEMKPSSGFSRIDVAGGKGYDCGAAGAFHQDSRLTSCSWSFVLEKSGVDVGPLLRQVDGNGVACSSDLDCGGLHCGQRAVRVRNAATGEFQPTTEIRMECGHQIGLWSPYQLCVWSGNSYVSPAPFEDFINCPAHHAMFACAESPPWTKTCYSPHEGSCCGCAQWQELLNVSVPKAHGGCKGSDPLWLRYALPWLEILKRACPTAYSYAFDDESSTFTCRSKGNSNEAEYVITLCQEPRTSTEAKPKQPKHVPVQKMMASGVQRLWSSVLLAFIFTCQ